jgi:hypothetical protein
VAAVEDLQVVAEEEGAEEDGKPEFSSAIKSNECSDRNGCSYSIALNDDRGVRSGFGELCVRTACIMKASS